ncbi:MAG: YcbK family protein [Hyphomicrobiales bacterium]|nr:YcbK family protein [Hyphomicrobiales bacterium]
MVPRILILIIAAIGMNACISREVSDVLQIEQQLNVDKQKPLATTEGALISVPQSSPLKSNSAQLTLTNTATIPDSANVKKINRNFRENAPTDNNAVPTNTPHDVASNQPVNAQSVKKPKPNLLALLFQRNTTKKILVNEPVKAVDDVNANQITSPVGGIVVPAVRSAQSGKLVIANNLSVEDNLSTPEVSNTNQAIDNPIPQNSAVKKQNHARKKPGFFASLLQRNRKNVRLGNKPIDDRHNSILLSSRTSSRANQVTATPITAGLANISNVINDQNGKNTRLASSAGLSRNAVNGIVTQHSGVNVDCITPGVVRILQYVEQRYGSKPVVSSGYRSPSRNRRAGGARNSMHIYCRAVDIQVKGVSKWHLAKFLRTVPGRGGVGTYCRTKSVHIDTGPKRDWHYPCRRKSKRRRKA